MTEKMKETETKVLQYLLSAASLPNQPLVTAAGITALVEIVTTTAGTKHVKYLMENSLADILSRCLENATVRTGQPYNSLVAMVAMKLIYHLSRLWHVVIHPLMKPSFFEKLLNFVNRDGDLFNFSDEFKKEFSSLVVRKQLIGNVVREKMSVERSRGLTEDGILSHLAELPKHICRCRLFDTSGEKDLDISQNLIGQNLAWQSCDTDVNDVDNWHDIVVTKVISKHYFFALVGKEAIRHAGVIKSMIDPRDLQPAVIEDGKIVLVEVVSSEGSSDYFRGHVTSNQGEWVKVMLLDKGGLLDVQMDRVYELPSSISLLHFGPQTSICCLAGVTVSPVDLYTAQLAVASLCNLIKYSVQSGVNLLKTSCVDVLRTVLTCPDPVLVLQSIRVLNNLSSNPRTDKSVFEKILIDLLDLMKDLYEMEWSIKLKEDISFAAMSCIANILHQKKEHRTLFYQHEGLYIVLGNMVRQHPHHSRPINRIARQLLRNFLPGIVKRPKVSSSGSDTVKRKEVDSQATELRTNSGREISGNVDNEFSNSNVEAGVSNRCHENFKQPGHEDDGLILSTDDEDPGSLTAVKQGKKLLEIGQAYLYNSEVSFSDDMTHDLQPGTSLQDVAVYGIAETVCGMLNSQGGSIYFGITKDRRVRGVKTTRDVRDSFRLGVDQMMMQKIIPTVLYIQFELVCTPVLLKHHSQLPGEYTHISDVNVIEIRIHHSRGTVHTLSASQGCYFRFGPNNLRLSAKEVRELVVVAEEDNYKGEILSLKLRLKKLKDAAAL